MAPDGRRYKCNLHLHWSSVQWPADEIFVRKRGSPGQAGQKKRPGARPGRTRHDAGGLQEGMIWRRVHRGGSQRCAGHRQDVGDPPASLASFAHGGHALTRRRRSPRSSIMISLIFFSARSAHRPAMQCVPILSGAGWPRRANVSTSSARRWKPGSRGRPARARRSSSPRGRRGSTRVRACRRSAATAPARFPG